MTLHSSESFSDEPFVNNVDKPQRSIFVTIEELNALVHDAEVDRKRIKALIKELEDAQDRIQNLDPDSKDLISIQNTLEQDRLAEIMLEGED